MNALLMVVALMRADTGQVERAARVAAVTLTVVDALQTRQIAHEWPVRAERWNPVLGEHPSDTKVVAYFGVVTVGLTWGLPQIRNRTVRRLVLGAWLVTEAVAVVHNHAIGVRIRY